MKPRHVRFTSTARQHLAQEQAWWLENREHPEVFAEELEQALKIVAVLPGAGTIYAASPVRGVRRVYLRRIGLHLYYTFDNEAVFVQAVWGSRRERHNCLMTDSRIGLGYNQRRP